MSGFKKKMTANGEVSYTDNREEHSFKGNAYSVKLRFNIGNDEMLLGMGQYEDGIWITVIIRSICMNPICVSPSLSL